MSDKYDIGDHYDDGPETDDLPCPACGHHETRSQDCHECDELNEVCECIDDLCQGSGHCIHGDGMVACHECAGTGIARWCPKCGANYWRAKRAAERKAAKGNNQKEGAK